LRRTYHQIFEEDHVLGKGHPIFEESPVLLVELHLLALVEGLYLGGLLKNPAFEELVEELLVDFHFLLYSPK